MVGFLMGKTERDTMKKLVVHGIALLTSLIVRSETVAWYHFDSGTVGEKAAVTDKIQNDACPGKRPLLSRQMSGSSVWSVDSPSVACYDTSLSGEATWRDGRLGPIGKKCIGLHLMGSTDFGPGSVLVVEDDPALRPAKEFTAEMMFRFDTKYSRQNQQMLVEMAKKDGSVVWSVVANANGAIRFDVLTADGAKFVIAGGVGALDGKWHHVAVTYDGARIRIYFDYNAKNSTECTGELSYGDPWTHKLAIGGYLSKNYGRWAGWIDEFRFTDRALQPDDFVRQSAVFTK